MVEEQITEVARLLRDRNQIDEQLAAIVQRPMTAGHLGEWIASQVFDIELEVSAVAAAIDGHFRTGRLRGRTVNIKWYLKREGLLDMTTSDVIDYYLVLTGPHSAAISSRGQTRPWRIDAVYVFDARKLRADLEARGCKIGVASSVRQALWRAAEIYPTAANPEFTVSPEQATLLRLFG